MAGTTNINAYSLATPQKGKRRPRTYREESPMSGDDQPIAVKVSAILTFSTPLASGAHSEQTMTVDGAAVGDVVTVTPEGDPGTGCVWSAWISDDDEVTVRLANPTGSSATPLPLIWHAVVIRLAS